MGIFFRVAARPDQFFRVQHVGLNLHAPSVEVRFDKTDKCRPSGISPQGVGVELEIEIDAVGNLGEVEPVG